MRCLESDPAKRPTASHLLTDPFWISMGNANELVDLNPTKSLVSPTAFLSNIDEALISLSSDQSQSSSQLHSMERKQSISVGDGGSSNASVVRDISPPQELDDINSILRSNRIERINNVQLVIGLKKISFDYIVEVDTPKSIAQQILQEGLGSDLRSMETVISQAILKRI